MPAPNVAVKPITFAIKVLNVKYSLRATPLKIVFISGIPEPTKKTWVKTKNIYILIDSAIQMNVNDDQWWYEMIDEHVFL